MLLFKKKFLEAIRRGEKTQTIRLWSHPRMRVGQRSYIPGAGYIRIESVEPVELAALSDADAIPDGFATADALRAELASIYAKELEQNKRLFRVCFRLTPEETKRPQLRAKPLLPANGFERGASPANGDGNGDG
jgi:hypothetical protein